MKISCIASELKDALFITQKVASKNLNLKELEYVLFNVKKDEIKLIATNIEVFVSVKISANSEFGGRFLIQAEVLYKIIENSNSDEKIELEYNSNTITIKTANSESTIKTITSEEFPTIEETDDFDNQNHINKEIILSGLKSTQNFSSQSLVKPELSAIYIYKENNDLVFVSTDMFRLAEKKILAPLDNSKFQDLLLPIKNAQNLIKILESTNDQEFLYSSTENQFSLKSKNLYISSRVIDGSFPDYKAIIPQNFKTEIVLLKSDLQDAIKSASLFSDEFGKLNLQIKEKENKIQIQAQNQQVGENIENIQAKIKGPDLEISFNHRYLSEGFNFINSDSLSLRFNDSNSPVIIKGISDESFLYIVMPMNK